MKSNKILVFIMMLVSLVFVTSCAQSTPIYRVTLNNEDGSVYDVIRFKQGESVQLEDITKEGYTFLGWYTNEDELIEDGYQFTSSMVLTAKFEINQYTYKFIVDGEVVKEETLDYGSEIVYPENPVKEATAEFNYEFIGWGKEDTVLTDNIEFVAEFKEVKNQYTYRFEDFDGTLLYEETVDYGTMPTEPNEPVREGFTFIGWDKEIEKVVDDVVYTAMYEEIVEFTLEGKTISILGDSISTFYAEGSEMNSYYGGENQFYYPRYSSTIKTVDLTWWYQLIKNTSLKLGVNNSWSGSCAFGTGSSAGQNDGRINTIIENGNPDIVIIYLGTNDCASGFSVAEFSSAIKTMIEKINNICDAQIFLTTLGYTAYTGMSYSETLRKDYNAALRNIAAEQNCGIVPLDEYIVEDNYMIYLGDNLHYNAKGAKLLSKIYEKAIKEYFDIAFDEEIEVEHKEQLPEGVIGKLTATATSGFWSAYETEVFLYEAASAEKPTFSYRMEITLNEDNNTYYVTNIYKSGVTGAYSGDYVIIISDSHNSSKELIDGLSKVVVGSIVEFDPTGSLPIELTFKTGDGNAPSGDGGDDPVGPDPIDPVEGALHVGAYNTGVWTVYDTTVICYDYATLNQGSTYANFYLIKLNKGANEGEYVVSAKKDVDVTEDFAKCDLYIMIYRDLAVKTFFDTCSVGQTVTVTGDITSGDAYLSFN